MRQKWAFFFFLIAVLSVNAAPEYRSEEFTDLGTFADYKFGLLELGLWQSDATWVNGQLKKNDDDSIMLRSGDTVIGLFGRSGYFLKFRLDNLTSKKAVLTEWRYRSIRTAHGENRSYTVGRLFLTKEVTIDFSQVNCLLIDDGPNFVEVGSGITTRSKN